METAKTTEFMGYTLQRGEARRTPHSIIGEFHFYGKRGAHYVTIRRYKKDGTPGDVYKFMIANSGVFVNIAGNYALHREVLERKLPA
jgi:hypothetical protein